MSVVTESSLYPGFREASNETQKVAQPAWGYFSVSEKKVVTAGYEAMQMPFG